MYYNISNIEFYFFQIIILGNILPYAKSYNYL